MTFINSILTPFNVLLYSIFYLLITLVALYYAFKNEKSFSLFIWTVVILLLPLIGSLIYFLKYFARHSQTAKNN